MGITLAVRAGFAALLLTATAVRADVVSDWYEFTEAVGEAAYVADAGFNPATFQTGAKLTLAMFEATDSIDRKYASFLHVPLAAKGASATIAAATAAHDVLVALYPAQKAMIEDRYCLALAGEADGAGKAGGIAAGHAAAAAALASGGTDPAIKPVPYWPATPAGMWVATAPTVIDAHYLTVRPWLIASATQFRPAPPVAPTDPRWARDVAEVHGMGGKASTERSAADTVLARFWAPYSTTPALRAIASQRGRSLVRNARFYAMYELVGADTGLAMAEAKLHYGFWRPIQAIHAGSGTAADPAWEPLLKTPLHPEYPCGHCVGAAVDAAVMAAEGPPPPGGIPFSNSKMPGVVVTVKDYADYVRQVSFSRICGGVHFRSSAEASEAMGRKLAAYAMTKFAPPI